MNLTLTLSGTIEEITYAITAINDREARDKKILTPMKVGVPTPIDIGMVHTNVIQKKKNGRPGKKVEIKIDGVRFKVYDSLTHAAAQFNCSVAALSHLRDTGRLLNKTYTVHSYS